MRPVWMVRSRQIAQKLSFWLTLIGYNPRDRSLSHRIYLVYASIFMSLWGFAVLLFAASATSIVLTMLGIRSANQVAAQVSLFILVIWFLYQFWQVSRHSPFVFSEEDAYLICQTPVRRSFVAISWFLGDWFTQALPFWALGVTFGFAMIETQLGGNVPFSDLFPYLASGLRALSIFFFLHLGLLAALWALGALRLQDNRERRWLPRLVLIVILLVIGSLILGIVKPEFAALVAPLGRAIAWPLRFSLQAAFSLHAWISGIVLASGIAVFGLVALVIAGEGLNLSRAAQESTQREKLKSAQRYGMLDLAREMKQRDRLGIGRSPARLLAESHRQDRAERCANARTPACGEENAHECRPTKRPALTCILGACVRIKPGNANHLQCCQSKYDDDQTANLGYRPFVCAKYLTQRRHRAAPADHKDQRKAKHEQKSVKEHTQSFAPYRVSNCLCGCGYFCHNHFPFACADDTPLLL